MEQLKNLKRLVKENLPKLLDALWTDLHKVRKILFPSLVGWVYNFHTKMRIIINVMNNYLSVFRVQCQVRVLALTIKLVHMCYMAM